MTPQHSSAQLEHAAKNGKKLVDAKSSEIGAFQEFKKHAPAALGELLRPSSGTPSTESRLSALQDAVEEFFTAKIARAEVELEELEMQLKAIEHMQRQHGSMIHMPKH